MTEAIEHWERNTSIKFVARTAQRCRFHHVPAFHRLLVADWQTGRRAVHQPCRRVRSRQRHPRDRPCRRPMARAGPRGPRELHHDQPGQDRGRQGAQLQPAHQRRGRHRRVRLRLDLCTTVRSSSPGSDRPNNRSAATDRSEERVECWRHRGNPLSLLFPAAGRQRQPRRRGFGDRGSASSGATVITAVRTESNTLKLISWRVNNDGSVSRTGDSGDAAGTASHIDIADAQST